MHNNVYFCDSIAVNSSISICYDAVWLLFKYKELRKLRNKVINIVFVFVEEKNHCYCIAKNYTKRISFIFKTKQHWKLYKLA